MKEEKISPAGFSAPETPSSTPQPPQGRAQENAKQTAQTAKVEIEKLKGAAREQGSAAVEEIKTAAQSAAREAQEAGRDFLHEQKEKLAQKVDEYAEAVRAASQRLRSEEGNVLATPAQRAAEQLGRISSYLREKEPGDALDDLESFARRKPEVVFGAFFAVGLAAARFFKASRKRPRLAGPPQLLGNPGSAQLSAAAPTLVPIRAATEPVSAPSGFPPAPSSSPATAPTSSTP